MKRVFFFLGLFVVLRLNAQTVLTPPQPAISPSSIAPAITPSTVSSPALTAPLITTPTASNVAPASLMPLLTNLEATVVQTLPTLAAFNDKFDFVQSGTAVAAPSTTTGTSGTKAINVTNPTPIPLVIETTTNPFVLPSGLEGLGTTNGAGTFTITRDSLRALLVLESDLERILPVLDAINGGTNFVTGVMTTSTNFGAGTTNR